MYSTVFLFCFVLFITSHGIIILSPFLILNLSLENDVMAKSKRYLIISCMHTEKSKLLQISPFLAWRPGILLFKQNFLHDYQSPCQNRVNKTFQITIHAYV